MYAAELGRPASTMWSPGLNCFSSAMSLSSENSSSSSCDTSLKDSKIVLSRSSSSSRFLFAFFSGPISAV